MLSGALWARKGVGFGNPLGAKWLAHKVFTWLANVRKQAIIEA